MIRRRADAKPFVDSAFSTELDEFLRGHRFVRRRGGAKFVRKVEEGKQSIEILFRFRSTASIEGKGRFYPWVSVQLPEVNRIALEMVQDDWLLAGEPDLTIRQPLEFAASKKDRSDWEFSDEVSVLDCVRSIRLFLETWGLKFLDDYRSAESICIGMQNHDERLMMLQQTVIYAAAAYLYRGMPKQAGELLATKLGKAGSRKQFAKAFEYMKINYRI